MGKQKDACPPYLTSALEHAVPEQMFTNAQNPGEAISAVKALQKASTAGQRIYHITQANQDTTLPNIHHDVNTLTEITNALSAGKEVITHTDAVSVPSWSGAGYIIIDPDTGDGAYRIAGGGNGGNYSAESVALLSLAFLSIFATGGLFTLSIIGALAAILTLVAAYLGTILLVYELIEDPGQFWEEKGQITYIVLTVFLTIIAPASGVTVATSDQELYIAWGWIVSAILSVIGAI